MYRGTYYRDKLSANKLVECYEIAPQRIKQYLEAEIQFVISSVHFADLVLELGCGYGRVMKKVSIYASQVIGNDISKESLRLAEWYLKQCANCSVSLMDASQMAFDSDTFDVVFCIQNGISAFGVSQRRLIAESARVTKEDGVILFSSYSPNIWQSRLEWFRKQSQQGLIGEIDEDKTSNGAIVCKDGFKASAVSGNELAELFAECGLKASIVEVDESSVFASARKIDSRGH